MNLSKIALAANVALCGIGIDALPKERKTAIQGFFRLKGISTL
jgi:hypothetical protein